MESVYYESAGVRIEVMLVPTLGRDLGLKDHYTWFAGTNVRFSIDSDGGRYEYNGQFATLDECLGDAAGELLSVDDAEFAVSRDQRTPVRP